jgi:hypothetical protein
MNITEQVLVPLDRGEDRIRGPPGGGTHTLNRISIADAAP